MRYGNRTPPATLARDAILRAAASEHGGNLNRACSALADAPAWRDRPTALAGGLALARRLVDLYGSARAAEVAMRDASARANEQLLDSETA